VCAALDVCRVVQTLHLLVVGTLEEHYLILAHSDSKNRYLLSHSPRTNILQRSFYCQVFLKQGCRLLCIVHWHDSLVRTSLECKHKRAQCSYRCLLQSGISNEFGIACQSCASCPDGLSVLARHHLRHQNKQTGSVIFGNCKRVDSLAATRLRSCNQTKEQEPQEHLPLPGRCIRTGLSSEKTLTCKPSPEQTHDHSAHHQQELCNAHPLTTTSRLATYGSCIIQTPGQTCVCIPIRQRLGTCPCMILSDKLVNMGPKSET
jgi:hypothetical protein